jgi:hypothetical protein
MRQHGLRYPLLESPRIWVQGVLISSGGLLHKVYCDKRLIGGTIVLLAYPGV